jgi:hypothetical protein
MVGWVCGKYAAGMEGAEDTGPSGAPEFKDDNVGDIITDEDMLALFPDEHAVEPDCALQRCAHSCCRLAFDHPPEGVLLGAGAGGSGGTLVVADVAAPASVFVALHLKEMCKRFPSAIVNDGNVKQRTHTNVNPCPPVEEAKT